MDDVERRRGRMRYNVLARYLGAEALVSVIDKRTSIVVVKDRIPRKYRIKEIDTLLRRRRTKQEYKLMSVAFSNGIPVPKVYSVSEFYIEMEYVHGEKKRWINTNESKEIAGVLVNMHDLGIIHGDFTSANIIFRKSNAPIVIDFGLGFFSKRVEDIAIDIFTTLRSFRDYYVAKSFLSTYLDLSSHPDMILKRLLKIRERFRYGRRFAYIDDALSSFA